MTALEFIHGSYIHRRRVHKLCDAFEKLIPRNARTLDIGCGDGWLTHLIAQRRPDIDIRGIDIMVRPGTHVPVTPFDGHTIPFADKSFDAAMLVDVLHHADDPFALLREAARVTRQRLIIKDHFLKGLLARETLVFMDRLGNARHQVVLPFNYWTPAQWTDAFDKLALRVASCESKVNLYPWPLSILFGRSLHFVAAIEPRA